MASKLQIHRLLLLPPSLRCLSSFPLARSSIESRIFTNGGIRNRLLSTTRFALAKKPKSPKSTTISPFKASKPAAPFSKPPPLSPTLASPPSSFLRMEVDLQRVFQTAGRILLYRAPSHTSFYISSYLFGGIFIYSAYLFGKYLDPSWSLPWYGRSIVIIITVFIATIGTAFLLAPSKLIRYVSIVANPSAPGGALLRFETKSAVPFLHRLRGSSNNVLEAPVGTVFIDRRIWNKGDIFYTNVLVNEAQEFTDFFSNPDTVPKPSLRDRVRAFNNALLNIWPLLKRDVRRMFLRDGIAYVRIGEGGGMWKLDIHGSLLLDDGKPLKAAMKPSELDRSWFASLRSIFR